MIGAIKTNIFASRSHLKREKKKICGFIDSTTTWSAARTWLKKEKKKKYPLRY